MSSNHPPNEEQLLPGREYPQPDEEKIAADIVNLLKAQMTRLYPAKEKQLRQVHAKMNGCVKAEFTVEPGLSPELKIGLFKEEKSYPAWIRFSNGDTHVIPDKKKDFRGFAIKIMNVPGKKLDMTDPDIPVHDFILMNRKIFFSKDIRQFVKILSVLTTPHTLSSIPRKLWIIISNLPTLLNAKKGKIKIKNPAGIPFFSTVPYRFGDESRAVKYAVIPSSDNKPLNPDNSSDDFLRVNLAATLKEHQLYYDFCVQFQTDPEKMPIENPSVEWDSPLIKLATIRIPTQVFDTAERNKFGDDLAFNPLHCLPEHKPIGSFNRVRKIIYEEMYRFRHHHNNVKDEQPIAGPDFFNDTNNN